MTKFLFIIDSVNEWIGKVVSFIAIVLAFVVVYYVVTRYFFQNPPVWGLETTEMMLLVLVCLGGGYTLLHKGHVRVDIIYSRFPPRAKAIVDLITYLIIFFIAAVLVWYGSKTTLSMMRSGELSYGIWAFPLWPTWLMVPIAGVLLGLQCLAKWVRDWVTALTGVELKSKVVPGEGGLRG